MIMPWQRNIRNTALWALSLVFVLMFSGCESRSSYKTLSFFFDGVPDPDKVANKGLGAGKEGLSAGWKGSIHGPFASKNCEACHNRTEGNALVLPIDKLCYKCHVLNFENMKWVHGPLVAGGCRVCHSPHKSGYPFLLDAPVEKLCYKCHERKAVLKNKAHEDLTVGCIECHNPHASQQQFMLR
jgi:predicted CXXCH cytochrome family protein